MPDRRKRIVETRKENKGGVKGNPPKQRKSRGKVTKRNSK